MIILQTDTTRIASNAESNDFWFIVEIIIIVCVIAYQLYHSGQVYKSITELKSIFDYRLKVLNGFIERVKLNESDNVINEIHYEANTSAESTGANIIKLSLVETTGKNEIIKRIKTTLNTYLINNYGAAVNFSVIKDIIDREVEVKDEEISQTITTPLYFGLAATMIGIIFGLMAMPNLGGSGFSEGINALIAGVKLAMFASLSGLACTTVLSSFFYKDAKKKILREKNEQLSYLQAKLLPELIKAEDTGVSGLKASLDRFAREATNISDNVLIAANQTGENLVLQQEVIDKIDKIDVVKISKSNLELFNKLDENMKAFHSFSKYLNSIELISSNLSEFAHRTANIDMVIRNINTSMNDLKILYQFISAHFEKIETAGDAALKSVGLAESHFESAIESLKNRTDEMIARLYLNAGQHESKLEDIYKEIQDNLGKITSHYVAEFSEAYNKSIPQFEQLDNLSVLPSFKEEFSEKTKEIQNNSASNIQQLLYSLDKLHDSTKELRQSINNQDIVSKLNDIEGQLRINTNNLSKNKERKVKVISTTEEPAIRSTDGSKPVTLRDLFNKLFNGHN